MASDTSKEWGLNKKTHGHHTIVRIKEMRGTELWPKVPDVCRPLSRKPEVNLWAVNCYSFGHGGKRLPALNTTIISLIHWSTASPRKNSSFSNLRIRSKSTEDLNKNIKK